MARGRAPGYQVQREEILARAAELFARNGFQGTSMNDVAEACGVSKPALYHYVRDKYQLLAEIAMAHVARLRTLVAEVQQLDLAPEPRARMLIERFVEAYANAQNDHRVLTEDVKFMQPEDRERVLDGQREVVDAFADAIAGVRPEVATARMAKPLTMLLFGMINWTFTWLQPKGQLRHADLAPMVADLFFGGLSAVRLPPVPVPRRKASKETTP
jgi:TetR/AcrR family transcriptional regulator